MLSVEPEYRRIGLGRELVKRSIDLMIEADCDEVMLETETTNIAALKLYESFGFIRDKRQLSYYLNGVDAFKLKLLIKWRFEIEAMKKMLKKDRITLSVL